MLKRRAEPVLRSAPNLYTGLCELSLAQNRIREAAKTYLLRDQERWAKQRYALVLSLVFG
ncbi:MAG: hypothetical protein H6669_17100 [Ardenticatenaceae bacterium]|nr:hypothetical protein [Ardenticatenaceae bacterium]